MSERNIFAFRYLMSNSERRCRFHGPEVREEPSLQATQPDQQPTSRQRTNVCPRKQRDVPPSSEGIQGPRLVGCIGQNCWHHSFPQTRISLKSRKQSVLICAKNIENIQGRVLLQTSPFHAYDTDKVVEHARNYAREFEKVGISKDRFCIKIPATGPAMNAGPILLKEGIRTLGTSLFSLSQAIAASQAGCLYISPYYNGMLETQIERNIG